MTLDELADAVSKEIGDENYSVVTKTDIVGFMNAGQLEIVRRTECLESSSVIPSVVDTASYIVTNALKINRVLYDGYGLVKVSKAQLNKWYPNREAVGYGNGTPNQYAVYGNKIELYPKPSSIKNIQVFYTPKPATLLDGGNEVLDIPSEMHDDLLQYCLRKAHEQLGDFEAAQYKDSKFGNQVVESGFQFAWNDAEAFPVVRDADGY